MKEYKAGDKLLCKRSMSNNAKHKKFFFVRGRYYEIMFYIDNDIVGGFFSIKNERGNVTSFSMKNKNRYKRLSRYFYTEKEIRKLKLKEIEKRRQSSI